MRNVIAWIVKVLTEPDTCSNKIKVIVLDDQESREWRRIRMTSSTVFQSKLHVHVFRQNNPTCKQ